MSVELGDVLRRIERRFILRQGVVKQLAQLNKLQYMQAPAAALNRLPSSIRTRFTRFVKSQQSQYDGIRSATPFVPSNAGATAAPITTFASTAHNTVFSEKEWFRAAAEYYQAVFVRDDIELHAFVMLTPEYPLRAPRFKLAFGRAAKTVNSVPDSLRKYVDTETAASVLQATSGAPTGSTSSASIANVATALTTPFDNDLHELETLINSYTEPIADIVNAEERGELCLLSSQLRRLQVAIDSMLDASDGSAAGAVMRAVRGRDRRRLVLPPLIA